MRGQPTLIAVLIAVACLVRFALGAVGYVEPMWLLGLDQVPGMDSVPYFVRIYAIRDIVLAVLLLSATSAYVTPLLIGCIVVDGGDFLAAILAGGSGAATSGETVALVGLSTALITIQAIALFFIRRRMRPAAQQGVEPDVE